MRSNSMSRHVTVATLKTDSRCLPHIWRPTPTVRRPAHASTQARKHRGHYRSSSGFLGIAIPECQALRGDSHEGWNATDLVGTTLAETHWRAVRTCNVMPSANSFVCILDVDTLVETLFFMCVLNNKDTRRMLRRW